MNMKSTCFCLRLEVRRVLFFGKLPDYLKWVL